MASHELRTPIRTLKLQAQSARLAVGHGSFGSHGFTNNMARVLRQTQRLEQLDCSTSRGSKARWSWSWPT